MMFHNRLQSLLDNVTRCTDEWIDEAADLDPFPAVTVVVGIANGIGSKPDCASEAFSEFERLMRRIGVK
jgi:hypothetical protein